MSSPIIKLPQVPKDLDPELRDYLLNINKILIKKQNEEYGENEKIDQRVIDLLYPIGERYIQLPEPDGTFSSAKSPEVKFGGEWACIFDEEGVFFRTEGGNSAESRDGTGIQLDELKSHLHRLYTTSYAGWMDMIGTHSALGFRDLATMAWRTKSLEATGGTETRPTNRLMRIWERIA